MLIKYILFKLGHLSLLFIWINIYFIKITIDFLIFYLLFIMGHDILYCMDFIAAYQFIYNHSICIYFYKRLPYNLPWDD